MKVIAFSLFRRQTDTPNTPVVAEGIFFFSLVLNVKARDLYWKNWSIWLYCDHSYQDDPLNPVLQWFCEQPNCKLIWEGSTGHWQNVFWRYKPMFDPLVSISVIRDLDNILTEYDSVLVRKWESDETRWLIYSEHRMEGTPISDIHVIFAAMAEEHRVAFDSAVPDPVSYMEENAQLTMNVTFSGDFFQFRPLLLRMCELPYLSAIETVRIRTEGDTRRMQLKLVLNQM